LKQWKARLPLGALLLAAIAGLTIFDASRDVPILGPTIAGVLGFVAFLEAIRLSSSVVRGPARAVAIVVAALAALVVVAAPSSFGVDPTAFAFAASASIAPLGLAALVFARRGGTVVQDDVVGPAVAALAASLTIAPLLSLGAIARLPSPEGVAAVGAARVGPWILLATVVVAKLNDIGGYLFGSLIGGRKLCPGVSPGKTWAGAIGGFSLALIGAAALASLLPALRGLFPLDRVLLFAAAISIAAQLGDLCESLVKRGFAAKDSGALLPAFGGAFDLVDSFILAGPVGYTLLRAGCS
jgi:phosphatidate cytidylyltransferase